MALSAYIQQWSTYVATLGVMHKFARGVEIGNSATTQYRQLSAAALAVAVVVATWIAIAQRDEPAVLLLAGCYLLLALMYYRSKGNNQVERRDTEQSDAAAHAAGVAEVGHDLDAGDQIALSMRQATVNAETVSRAKSESLAMMSHEVRTPMNAILGMVDLLQLTALTRKQQAYVRTIQSSGNTLLSFVDNVLDYSELQAGELVINKEAFDVRQCVEYVLEIMGFQAYSKGLELACRIAPDVPSHIWGDEDRLRQVLVNLVNNAVRFTSSGEVVIDIQTAVDAHGQSNWSCAVTDSGIGISEEDRTNLFLPFTRGDQQDWSHRQGSGLGLTICKWLVEGMGGSINVTSEHGAGTCVSCTLPLDEQGVPANDSVVTLLCGQSALIVHDNATIADIISAYLMDWGMRCDVVNDADAGFMRLQSNAFLGQPYSAAIVDANLPTLDGLSLARRIRAASTIAALPIVMLTPMAYPLEVGHISRIGGIRCVNKPVPPSELNHNLCKLIGNDETSRSAENVGAPGAHPLAVPGNLRILIAEDNALNRQLLQNMLMSLNYGADAVVDGPGVLRALAKHPYDLILMDRQMPGMDGDEVTRHIRSEPEKFRTQPVIVAITANVSAKQQAVCREAGMDDFIAKPVRRRKLVEGLQRWCTEITATRGRPSRALTLTPEQEVQAQMQNRANDDDRFLGGYIDLFVSDTDSRLKLLDDAVTREDWEAVRRQGHAIKGACMEMGASAMGQQCNKVRDATENGHVAEVPGALRDLKKEFERIRPVLEAAKHRSV